MLKDAGAGTSNKTAEYFDEIKQYLREKSFTSIEEANQLLAEFNKRRNNSPLVEFHGLSPDQMNHFLYSPFDSPTLVSFPNPLEVIPQAPVIKLFTCLVEAIGEKGLKATATGNLPRNFCRETALAYWGEERYKEETRYCGINREEDFQELNTARFIAEDAGLVKKNRGKFVITRKCRALLTGPGMAAVYPVMFKAYTMRFNWGYSDRYPEFTIIQRSFLFSLYLLNLYGDEDRTHTFYEDAFLKAYPAVLEQAMPMDIFTPEKQARKCFTLRTMVRFAEYFGLADVLPVGSRLLPDGYRIKALPLLNDIVKFNK